MTKIDVNFFKKRNRVRNYLHFDKKRSPSFVYEYVINPSNIVKHSFYPFIFYNLVDNKIKRVAKYYNNKLPLKERILVDVKGIFDTKDLYNSELTYWRL